MKGRNVRIHSLVTSVTVTLQRIFFSPQTSFFLRAWALRWFLGQPDAGGITRETLPATLMEQY